MPVTLLFVWLLLSALPTTLTAGSARIELAVSTGTVAEADYWPGAADRPAVLILHGWLQTHRFATVRRLAEALADEGLSVLTPSLSLGLDRRRQSLDCAAIHTHAMAEDVAELGAWARWLAQHAGKPPVLIGHGSGSIQVAALLEAEPELAVERSLMISPSDFADGRGADRLRQLTTRARAALEHPAGDPATYTLGHCGSYTSTAAAWLSYIEWDRRRIGRAVTRSTRPVSVIFGERDPALDRAWLSGLRDAGVVLRPVAGAHHLIDLANEFDLLDAVLDEIEGAGNG